MPSRSPSRSAGGGIDKLDFDSNRKSTPSNDGSGSEHSGPRLLDDDESLLSDVVDGIIERDRRGMRRTVTRYLSFVCAILNWYARLCYPTSTSLLSVVSVLSARQSLRRLDYSLLPLRSPLPISPPLYPASSQHRIHSRRDLDVPPCTTVWLPL